MSKPEYAVHSAACGTIEIDGKKLAVGSFRIDGVQKNGVWVLKVTIGCVLQVGKTSLAQPKLIL